MHRSRRLTALGLALAAFGLNACATPVPPFTPAAPSPEGRQLYETNCALCHGPDGTIAASITHPVSIGSQDFLRAVDDDFLRQTIALGRPGEASRKAQGTKMPAYGDPRAPILSAAQIDQVVAHLRSWQLEAPEPPEPFDAAGGDAVRGAAAYALRCASCHGPDGWMAGAPRLAGATLQATVSDAMIRHLILRGRAGKMPVFKLRDGEIADIIVFLRNLNPSPADP
ncbi:MAG: c-type cytochrome [Anaerolineae bacterium]